MIQVFEFNPFAENTYIVYDAGECLIIDPGCFDARERQILRQFIEDHRLVPKRLINTHCHLDHVFGNRWVSDTWNLGVEIHRGELPVLERYPEVAARYGLPQAIPSPMPSRFIEAGDVIEVGRLAFKALLTPGHSPASLSFYCSSEDVLISGDTLFHESIGRTDLPGGNHELLLESIRTQLFTLPGNTLVYPGHGPTTTIRHEMEENPWMQ